MGGMGGSPPNFLYFTFFIELWGGASHASYSFYFIFFFFLNNNK